MSLISVSVSAVSNSVYQHLLCHWHPADSALGRILSVTEKGVILSTSPVSLPNIRLGAPITSPTFSILISPLEAILLGITPLESSSNRPITFTFEYQLKSLIYYHTEEFTSAQALLEEMQDEESFAYHNLIPEEGLGGSTFYEANATRGVIQMLEVFDKLAKKVSKRLGFAHAQLGDLVAIDGSLIDATLSMIWASYTGSKNKAKVHIGFDLNRGIPRKLYFTDGKGAERPFVSRILEPGQTGVMDRGYQDHTRFDEWIEACPRGRGGWKALCGAPEE